MRSRHEGARCCSTLLRLQQRRLDLEESSLGQAATNTCLRGHAHTSHVTCFRAHDQVDVTLPDAVFLRQGFMRHRQRTQCLGGHAPLIRKDREFTTLGRDDLADHTHMVADVH